MDLARPPRTQLAALASRGHALVTLTRAVLAVSLVLGAYGSDRLNLVVILTDQHHHKALGVSGNGFGGVTQSLTPNLDQLAAEGVHVPRATCVSPQCMPSRVSLLTGRWPRQHGVRTNKIWEPANIVTLAELARREGYATATIGKHHLSWLDQTQVVATDHGFDEVLDLEDYSQFCHLNGFLPWLHSSVFHEISGLPDGLNFTGYTDNPNAFHPTGYFTDRAVEFLEARAASTGGDGRPFALWLSFYGPHTPIAPTGPADPEDWAHRYYPWNALGLPPNVDDLPDTERMRDAHEEYEGMSHDQHRQVLAHYYGLVSQIDHNVGRFLTRLDDLALGESTLVVFTSDHGEFASERGAWTKGGGPYDCVTRVPLILRLPGFFASGSRYEPAFGHIDFAPTLVDLIGLSPSDFERDRWDGQSRADALRTGLGPGPAEDHQFQEFQVGAGPLLRAVTTSTLKYSLDEMGDDELAYDLVVDPWERTNLNWGTQVPPGVGALAARLHYEWGDPSEHSPQFAVTGLPDQAPPPAKSPAPVDGAAGVPRDIDGAWIPATSTAFQEVYLSLDGGPMDLWQVLPAMASATNFGTLPAHALIAWRVDGVNENGTTTGTTWSFTTGAAPDGPGLASAPAPTPGAQGVPRDATLAWSLAPDATRPRLWFAGGDGPLELVTGELIGFQAWRPSGLQAGRAYRWRVDSVGPEGVTEGTEWSFQVDDAGLAEAASQPSPAHLELDVPFVAGTTLSWTPGAGATAHQLYFGSTFPLPLAAILDSTSFDPGTLAPGTTYHWRVDEVSEAGVRRGGTWRFTTL